MKIALYARVSTTDKGQNPEVQLLQLKDYCNRHFPVWDSLTEYVESKSAVKKRPVLEQLLKDAREHKIDTIVVWKIDRFARSMNDLVMLVLLLDQIGCRFIASSQGIDTDRSNPSSRLMMHIFGAMAEFERELIRERVKAGLAKAREVGKELGRPKRVFDIEEVHRLQAAGVPITQIAKRLKIGRNTLLRRLEKGA